MSESTAWALMQVTLASSCHCSCPTSVSVLVPKVDKTETETGECVPQQGSTTHLADRIRG